jgi:glycosyltransferase involved in cell wall biosynthesis
MPVYNEAGSVVEATREVQLNILDRVPNSELIVVNDGSRDNSAQILDEIASRDARVRVIHQANKGHGGALITALSQARGKYVMLIDSDRQISLDRFSDAWTEIEKGRDGVFGVRRTRHDPQLRLYLTKVVRLAIRGLFGVRIFDANVPYKVFRKSIWESGRKHIPDGTLTPSLFLAVYARRKGYDIAEMDVLHRERNTGVVSIRRLKLLRFCSRAFRQMLTFRRSLRNG